MFNRFVTYSKEIVDSYFSDKETKKEMLSEMFGEISNTLLKASIELEDNKFPEESCIIMKDLTESILKQTNYGKKDRYIIKLHKMLSDCSNLKNKYERNEIPMMICDLRKSSKEFKALSMAVSL
jgi:hypothetical protein